MRRKDRIETEQRVVRDGLVAMLNSDEFTYADVASWAGVTEKAARNWIDGSSNIPAYRLRMLIRCAPVEAATVLANALGIVMEVRT